MTLGHYPDRVALMLGFSGLIFVGLYFCNKTGVIPGKTGLIRRDEHPRIFQTALVMLAILAITGALCAIAIYCGFGLDLISN